MLDRAQWVSRVNERLDVFLSEHSPLLLSVSPELTPFVDYSRRFLHSGKRFRAVCAMLGYATVTPEIPDHVVDIACALEVFHAAALVHDDIMDNSDTRRGSPSVHKLFESLHTDSGWHGEPTGFGTSSALLLGDLLLSFSDELCARGLAAEPQAHHAQASRLEFNRMRLDVTAGQYLDIVEEAIWPVIDKQDALTRAHQVVLYKSAKYSIEAPLVIGAALAGATAAHLTTLREIGIPLGIAFQLRDDLLGVFGDPAVTGKPAGDDLREGKRTVLIALAQNQLPITAIRLMDELLGDPGLTTEQIGTLQQTLINSGAVDELEKIITAQVRRAHEVITAASFSAPTQQSLMELAELVTQRSA